MENNTLLLKKPEENDFEYHKRLVYGKLVDKTLADFDYTELAPYVYGKEFSGDVARRLMYGSARTLQLLDCQPLPTKDADDVVEEIDRKIFELKIERQKFYDQRAALNKVIRERSRQEELNEIIRTSIVDGVARGTLEEFICEPVTAKASDNDLIVTLNDMHYGIDIDNYWTVYNPEVCEEMLKKYMHRIINIAKIHNSQNCYVVCAGDTISGLIHLTLQLQNRENAVEQVKGVSELIAKFLVGLGKVFESVKYISVAGNHSRLNTKENSPKDERLDDLVEWYLKARLEHFENISFEECEKIDNTISLFDIHGKTYCLVHGDFDDSPAKISSLQAMVNRPIYAVILGHLHHNKVGTVNGIKTVMGGSFLGMDDYCIQKRIYGRPEQIVCVCGDAGITCHYDIELQGE